MSGLKDEMSKVFKLPITYNQDVKNLNQNIITDLELVKTIEPEEQPILTNVFNPTTTLGRNTLDLVPLHYTTNVTFLNETQKLIQDFSDKEFVEICQNTNVSDFDIEETLADWIEIKGETGFCEKYLYIDWTFAKFMNNNSSFLQAMSIYNIASPILSLCLPIVVLIVPFFIIRMKGIDVNMKDYIEILKEIISQHAISKVFTQFNEVDFGQKLYLVVSAAFYLFSIYQNILICVRFYSNMKKIHDYLFKFKKYLHFTIDSMNYFLSKSQLLTTYDKFNYELGSKLCVLSQLKQELDIITHFKLTPGNVTTEPQLFFH